jgi:hypothetical protein
LRVEAAERRFNPEIDLQVTPARQEHAGWNTALEEIEADILAGSGLCDWRVTDAPSGPQPRQSTASPALVRDSAPIRPAWRSKFCNRRPIDPAIRIRI